MFSVIQSMASYILRLAKRVGGLSRDVILTLVLGGLWLISIASGYLGLLLYERNPGVRLSVTQKWPSAADIKPFRGQYTLVMAVHPHCPCTRASVNELAILMTRCPEINAYVLAFRPDDVPRDWGNTYCLSRAQSISGVTVITDSEGREANEFGLSTSGEIVLFNPNGQISFKGGITGSRGHEGDNQGLDAIEAIATGSKQISCRSTPVYGCSLLDDPGKQVGKSRNE